VQLVDTESGNHLWAERFDKPIADLFDMQDEIVSRLANTLNAQFIDAEARVKVLVTRKSVLFRMIGACADAHLTRNTQIRCWRATRMRIACYNHEKHGRYTKEMAATRRWLREASQLLRRIR
jgi:hypothetical protein